MASNVRTLPLSEYAQELRQWLSICRQARVEANSQLFHHAYSMGVHTQVPSQHNSTANRPEATRSHSLRPTVSAARPQRAFPEHAG